MRNAAVAADERRKRSRVRRHDFTRIRVFPLAMPDRRGPRRFSARREVALGLGFYAAYLLNARVKRVEPARQMAIRNGKWVVELERRLGLHLEPALQRLLLPRRRLLATLNGAYVVANVGLTAGWLVHLFRRRDPEFHRLRRAALASGLGALPIFAAFPVAPPRSLEGFVDTIAASGLDLDRGVIAELYDPLAAMPSLHIAAAVVTAAGIVQTSESPVGRALAPAYPPLVAFVIFATANHYVLDAIAGAVLGGAALKLARALG